MKTATNTTYSEATIGMEFGYTQLAWSNEKGDFCQQDFIGKVTGITITKAGRIKLEVNGKSWGNGAKSPTSVLWD